jgi:DNA modification methylase
MGTQLPLELAPSNRADAGILYRDDNLERLASLPAESVDLIYLDPPFFSNRVYEVIWGDEAEVRSFEDRWEGGIQHYIGWMKDRVEEMHRVLKPTGSLYLHCDPHASHYLRVMLDSVFGQHRFCNEIIWKRTSAHNRIRRFGPVHDVILFYTKTDRWTWNPQHVPYDPDYAEANYSKIESGSGRRFSTADLTSNNPGSTYEWNGMQPPGERYWGVSEETMKSLDAEGRIYYTNSGLPRRKNYLDEMPGQLLQDVWTDLKPLHAQSNERRGYPTQKPEALLERIITASSNVGDVVLDPFCGCGTTVAVCERIGRQWIGIDISQTAIEIMRRRLWNQSRCVPTIVNLPETEAALRQLKPFEFQNYVVNVLNGTHSAKKSGDMGIDGHWFFTRDPIQVKQSEHVGRNVIDNFETAMRRAGFGVGYVVAFSFTRGAVEEVARAVEDGLNIRLIRVKELLLLTKRPGNPLEKFGPQPEGEVLPLPAMRKPSDLPTAEQLVESDRRQVG